MDKDKLEVKVNTYSSDDFVIRIEGNSAKLLEELLGLLNGKYEVTLE